MEGSRYIEKALDLVCHLRNCEGQKGRFYYSPDKIIILFPRAAMYLCNFRVWHHAVFEAQTFITKS